jgi:hypothetical protein
MSGHPAVQQAVRNNYFESLGLPKSMRPPKPNSVDSESKRKFRAVADAARCGPTLAASRLFQLRAPQLAVALWWPSWGRWGARESCS